MTLEKLRQNESFVDAWAKTLQTPAASLAMEMLVEMHPMRQTTPELMRSFEASANYLHYTQGYELALERIRLAAKPLTPAMPLPEASFETPEFEK